MSDDKELEPSAQWRKFRREIMQRIDEIDAETPFTYKEPQWWLDMQSVRDLVKEIHVKGETL